MKTFLLKHWQKSMSVFSIDLIGRQSSDYVHDLAHLRPTFSFTLDTRGIIANCTCPVNLNRSVTYPTSDTLLTMAEPSSHVIIPASITHHRLPVHKVSLLPSLLKTYKHVNLFPRISLLSAKRVPRSEVD